MTEVWEDSARCRGYPDVDFFFNRETQRAAVKFCSLCPVRLECASTALINREKYGVWGGLTERQRARLLRQGALSTSASSRAKS